MPATLRNATVAIEDERFYHHGGVDYESIVRAAFRDVTSGNNGSFSAGPGYDLVTGRGTPVVNKLVPDLIDRPAAIIATLDLLRPIYQQTAAFGHFGRTDVDLPWERTDKAEALRAAAGLAAMPA